MTLLSFAVEVLPNETVEKLILESTFLGQQLVKRRNTRSEGGETDG